MTAQMLQVCSGCTTLSTSPIWSWEPQIKTRTLSHQQKQKPYQAWSIWVTWWASILGSKYSTLSNNSKHCLLTRRTASDLIWWDCWQFVIFSMQHWSRSDKLFRHQTIATYWSFSQCWPGTWILLYFTECGFQPSGGWSSWFWGLDGRGVLHFLVRVQFLSSAEDVGHTC